MCGSVPSWKASWPNPGPASSCIDPDPGSRHAAVQLCDPGEHDDHHHDDKDHDHAAHDHGSHDEGHEGHHHEGVDPHIWLGPTQAR